MQSIGLLRQACAGVVLCRTRLFWHDVMLCRIRDDTLPIGTLNCEGTVDSRVHAQQIEAQRSWLALLVRLSKAVFYRLRRGSIGN